MSSYKSATKSCVVINTMEKYIPREVLEIIKSFVYTETEKCVKQSKQMVMYNISSMWDDMDEDTIESYSGVQDGWWVKQINSTLGSYIKRSAQFKEISTICFNSKSCLKCGNYCEPVYLYSYSYDFLTYETAPHLTCKCRLTIYM